MTANTTKTFDFTALNGATKITHKLRVIDLKGRPWFVTKDVAGVLELREHPNGGFTQNLRLLSADEKASLTKAHYPGYGVFQANASRVSIISESGLYKLIMRSDKPVARPFQDWVTSVVLPAIKETGGYSGRPIWTETPACRIRRPDWTRGAMKFDREKFKKVAALHDGATIPGEREAALRCMQAMAAKAGVTLEAARAVALPADGVGISEPASTWSFGNSPAFREMWEESGQRRRERYGRLIAKYGSEEKAWEPQEWERALEKAVAPVLRHDEYGVSNLDGWNGDHTRPMSATLRHLLTRAFAFPTTVQAAWAEMQYWDERGGELDTLGGGPEVWSLGRELLLEEVLRETPAVTLGDIYARLSWMQLLRDGEDSSSYAMALDLLPRLRDDIGTVVRRTSPREASPTTVAGRRARVVDILQSEEGRALSDREIARRVGVSPQTVNTWRRKGAEK